MKKPRKIIFTILLMFGIALNISYYWENLWTIWAKHYISDQDIIISFTTTPHRIRQLEEPLQCLARQNIPVRQIYLSLPQVFKRDNSEYVIPDWLDCYPNLTILRTEDYGPATKILGALKHADITADTIIIAVDDDTCYAKNLVLRLAVRAKMFPDQAIGASGAELDFIKNKDGGIVKIFRDHATVSILEGFAGIAYRPKFFNASIYEIKNEPDFCYNSDDLYISHHLARNNIVRQGMNNKYLDIRKHAQQLAYGFKEDALYKLENIQQAERYKACIGYLHEKFPEVIFNDNGIK